MAKTTSTFKNMFLSLSLIYPTGALLLAQVNKMTEKPIADAKAMKGIPLALITAGIMAMAFMGFSGIDQLFR